MGLSFTIAAGPRQRSHSQVRVPRDTWRYFTVWDSRLPQPGEPGPRIYIPQEQGGPVIPPRHWVTFSLPPTTRRVTVEVFEPASIRDWLGRPSCLQDNSLARTTWKRPVSNSTSIVERRFVAAGTCLPSLSRGHRIVTAVNATIVYLLMPIKSRYIL
jgi:hypothetical protein